MSRTQSILILAACSTLACAHKPDVAAAAPPTTAPAATAMAPASVPPARVRPACATDLACASGELCLDGACTAITPTLAACGLTRVHFDFDVAVVHADEYPKLQRMARCIQANRPSHVLITGNADERGTVEYNLALGQRRAAAVQTYLADLGVPTRSLQLVTYGKEMPLCVEHDEACWQRNRRSGIQPGATPQDVTGKVKADEQREQVMARK